ncbi:unnamed protein product [Owenia fusiformis]|uniref:Uncharacterized protein n=1 Tax=Owenia fusiformis TaxID=6347 RepID=A0A8J1XTE9_OWEFU|nr:unnamed protein product [Owenia fusiformis]
MVKEKVQECFLNICPEHDYRTCWDLSKILLRALCFAVCLWVVTIIVFHSIVIWGLTSIITKFDDDRIFGIIVGLQLAVSLLFTPVCAIPALCFLSCSKEKRCKTIAIIAAGIILGSVLLSPLHYLLFWYCKAGGICGKTFVSSCEDGWVKYETSCYSFINSINDSSLSFDDGQQKCSKMIKVDEDEVNHEGHANTPYLACIDDIYENHFIQSYLKDHYIEGGTWRIGAKFDQGTDAYICESTLYKSAPIGYSNMDNTQLVTKEDKNQCMVITKLLLGYKWQKQNCGVKHVPHICEVNAACNYFGCSVMLALGVLIVPYTLLFFLVMIFYRGETVRKRLEERTGDRGAPQPPADFNNPIARTRTSAEHPGEGPAIINSETYI